MENTNLPKYLTPQELSKMLGVSVFTVYGWTSSRVIPFVKLGRLVRFEGSKITAWLKQKQIPCIGEFN